MGPCGARFHVQKHCIVVSAGGQRFFQKFLILSEPGWYTLCGGGLFRAGGGRARVQAGRVAGGGEAAAGAGGCGCGGRAEALRGPEASGVGERKKHREYGVWGLGMGGGGNTVRRPDGSLGVTR